MTRAERLAEYGLTEQTDDDALRHALVLIDARRRWRDGLRHPLRTPRSTR